MPKYKADSQFYAYIVTQILQLFKFIYSIINRLN